MSNSTWTSLISFFDCIKRVIISFFSRKKSSKKKHFENIQIVIGSGKTKSNIKTNSALKSVDNKQVVLGSGESKFNLK